MKKRIVALFLVVVLIFSFSTTAFAATWTENVEMRNITNKHFLTWTQAAVATGISSLAGGTVTFWTGLASSVYANAVCTETQNVYFDIRYYWQPSYTDPQLPYYIKQVVNCYSDIARTQFIGSKERYYYSNMTFSNPILLDK